MYTILLKSRDLLFLAFLVPTAIFQLYMPQTGVYTDWVWGVHMSIAALLTFLAAAVIVSKLSCKLFFYYLLLFSAVITLAFWHLEDKVFHFPMIVVMSLSVLKMPLLIWTKSAAPSCRVLMVISAFFILLSAGYSMAGLHVWGLYPGDGVPSDLPLRSAVFPYSTPPYSGFFAVCLLVVALMNRGNRGLGRAIIVTLSIWFLIMSLSRTVYVAGLGAALSIYLQRIGISQTKEIILVLSFFFTCLWLVLNPGPVVGLAANIELLDAFSLARSIDDESSTRGLMISAALADGFEVLGQGWEQAIGGYTSVGGSEIALFFFLSSYGLLGLFFMLLAFGRFLSYRESLPLVFVLLVFYAFYSSFIHPYSIGILWYVLCLSAVRESRSCRRTHASNGMGRLDSDSDLAHVRRNHATLGTQRS